MPSIRTSAKSAVSSETLIYIFANKHPSADDDGLPNQKPDHTTLDTGTLPYAPEKQLLADDNACHHQKPNQTTLDIENSLSEINDDGSGSASISPPPPPPLQSIPIPQLTPRRPDVSFPSTLVLPTANPSSSQGPVSVIWRYKSEGRMKQQRWRWHQGLVSVKQRFKSEERATRYHCNKCEDKFSRQTDFEKHSKDAHSEDRPWMCLTCGEKFLSNRDLTAHGRVHSKHRWKCPGCPMEFKYQYSLKRHEEIHKSPWQCSSCLKPFKFEERLKKHQILHSDERQWKCPICPTSFTTRILLGQHKRRVHFLFKGGFRITSD
jgi:rubrerythrin